MAVAVKSPSELAPFTFCEEGSRQLKFAEFRRQRQERVGTSLAPGHLVKAISQGDQSVERNQALVVHDLVHPPGHQQSQLLTFFVVLLRAREQGKELVLGYKCFSCRGAQKF